MKDDSGTIQFLSEARSGDRAGMGRLAELVWERVYPFVLRTTLDRHATEDIIQDTLLTMLRRIHSLRDNRRFWPWIYRIAWNKIQDCHRDRKLQSACTTALLRRGDIDRDGNEHKGSLLDVQVREEVLQQVTGAITRLNRHQRDILQLRCYDELPYAEIASRTSTTPEKARLHFHRAKKSLKAHLQTCST